MIQNSSRPCRNERGVSPVVGVMLMLVVVIIIAAIVSGFSGNLLSGSSAKKAPTLSMDVKVVNTGYWQGSGFFATVTGVSEPIPTKDLKIVTSWKGRERYNGNSLWWSGMQNTGPSIAGGSTVVPNGSSNINVLFTPADPLSGLHAAPLGTGPGVNGTESLGKDARSYSLPQQQFGNYTLMQGTTLSARPVGSKDASSLGSSGQGNSFGGYGASNASYQYWVPETTSQSYCHRWRGTDYGWSIAKIYDPSSPPTCADTYLAKGDRQGTSAADCESSNSNCFYIELGTTTPGYYATAAETKGKKYLYMNCGNSCIDPAKTVLGATWYNLNWGDTVNVKVIHIPTGKVIFQQDVPVTE